MEEQEKKDFPFIKEKIKEKPVNKKRLCKQGIYTAGLAVLFGLVACFVFTAMRPVMERWLYPEEESLITIPRDEEETEENSSDLPAETESVENQTEVNENTGQAEGNEAGTQQEEGGIGPQAPAETAPSRELELSDYQQLQNKIYAIGKEANRSIVTVTGVTSDMDWYNNAYESTGQASGVIIGDNKRELLILTEHKAIADAEAISVTFIDEVTLTAALKNYDGNTGLAILAVDMEQIGEATKNAIAYAVLGNSMTVAQGNIAIAIGSPLGTIYSIGTGNITSVGNVIQTIDNTYSVFTTDIVGSSSSSGVLLNLNGEVVGLVMQDYSSHGEENTLTAISISDLKKLIEMLSNGRDIPYLGLKAVTVTDKIAADYDIPKGVYIKEVVLDSPALEAGLQSGDVIVEMNGEEVASLEEYEDKILELQPGASVQVAVMRQGMNDYIRLTCDVTAGRLR